MKLWINVPGRLSRGMKFCHCPPKWGMNHHTARRQDYQRPLVKVYPASRCRPPQCRFRMMMNMLHFFHQRPPPLPSLLLGWSPCHSHAASSHGPFQPFAPIDFLVWWICRMSFATNLSVLHYRRGPHFPMWQGSVHRNLVVGLLWCSVNEQIWMIATPNTWYTFFYLSVYVKDI